MRNHSAIIFQKPQSSGRLRKTAGIALITAENSRNIAVFLPFSPPLRADVRCTAIGALTRFTIGRSLFPPLSVVIIHTSYQCHTETLLAFVPAVSTGIVVSYTTVNVSEEDPFVLSVFLFSLCFHISFLSSIETPFFGGKNRA